MVRKKTAILVFAATLVSAWLLAGPPTPPYEFDRTEATGVGSRTITWEIRGIGMLAPLEMSHEQHRIYLPSGGHETVSKGVGFHVNNRPMAITLVLLLSIWTCVILAYRRNPPAVSSSPEIAKS